MQKMNPDFKIFLIFVLSVGICSAGELKMKYYHKRCSSAEDTVRDITWRKVAENPTLAAKLSRLHYHDCFVRGCDASILLDTTKSNNAAEKSAPPNRSILGYEIIDEIKAKLEEECPGVVSCADIVALSARDAVSYQFQRPMWTVFTGREDGRVSTASEAIANLPSASANFTTLLKQFENNGLDIMDLVTLSGAHTIGVTHCTLVARRLYNFTGKGDADPSLNPDYAKALRNLCPNPINPATILDMDPQSSLSFDGHYYRALNENKGIFRSDAALLTDPRAVQIARVLQHDQVFFARFAQSMRKMGAIGVLTNGEGEIRKNCRAVNA